MKKIILIISIVILVVAALSFRFAVWGISIPFILPGYYTSVYFKDISIPDPQKFSDFLEQDGWQVHLGSYGSPSPGSRVVQATKEPKVFLSKPKISVQLFSSSGIPKEGTKGYIYFYINDGSGNKVANRRVFNDFVRKINDNFNLNLSYDRYNYLWAGGQL